jgi:hypothetical protein
VASRITRRLIRLAAKQDMEKDLPINVWILGADCRWMDRGIPRINYSLSAAKQRLTL